jgi:hypothetical protein
MKKLITLAIALAMLATMILPVTASAAETGIVSITTGSQTISVGLTPDTWATGAIVAGTPNTTFNSAKQGYFTITNEGSVTENFMIKGTNATGSSVTWTLVTTPDAVDEYSLGFGQAEGSGTYTECTDYTEFGTTDVSLTTGLTVSSTYKFDLALTAFTGSNVNQMMAATVTITAVAP